MMRPLQELKISYYAQNRYRISAQKKARRAAGLHTTSPEAAARIEARRKANRLFFIEKLGGKCADCGYCAHPSALQFDHVDPSQKLYEIAKLIGRMDRDFIWAEVKKCVLRCANCHIVKSIESGDLRRHGRGNGSKPPK